MTLFGQEIAYSLPARDEVGIEFCHQVQGLVDLCEGRIAIHAAVGIFPGDVKFRLVLFNAVARVQSAFVQHETGRNDLRFETKGFQFFHLIVGEIPDKFNAWLVAAVVKRQSRLLEVLDGLSLKGDPEFVPMGLCLR